MMKFDISSLIHSIFKNGSKTSQSINISGDKNVVEQKNIILRLDSDTGFRREIVDEVLSEFPGYTNTSVNLDISDEDDQEDIKRIVEYRKIASDGDSVTALKLLKSLAKEEKYSSGHTAFRLNFNIGIVYQNIGDLDTASS